MLFVLLIGCSANSSQQTTNTTTGATTTDVTTTTEGTQAEDKTPITFTAFNIISDPNENGWQSPVAKKITELTGVTLKIEYAVGDYNEKIALMAASGTYPDFLYLQDATAPIFNAGGVIKLDEYIEKYGENVKKFFGDKIGRMRRSLEDPGIYYLATASIDGSVLTTSGGFELQHAVLKELGYPKITTVQDFENAIKTYIEKYPTIDGKPTIGMSVCCDDWRVLISVGCSIVYSTGITFGTGAYTYRLDFNDTDYKVQVQYKRPEFREYMKWLNHMYNVGLMDPDCVTQKYDDYLAKISSGRVLGLSDFTWEYGAAETALRQANMEDRTYAVLPVVLKEGMKNSMYAGKADFTPAYGYMISSSCKDPVRAFKFLDWMCTDEAQILTNWGIEGVNYTIENGKRVRSEEETQRGLNDPNYRRDTGVGVYAYPFPSHGHGVLDPTGNTYSTSTDESIMENYTESAKATLNAYGVKMWSDLFPKPEDFDMTPYGSPGEKVFPPDSEANIIQTNLRDLEYKYYGRLIVCDPSEFDSIMDSWLKEIDDANAAKLEELTSKLLQDVVKLYNMK